MHMSLHVSNSAYRMAYKEAEGLLQLNQDFLRSLTHLQALTEVRY